MSDFKSKLPDLKELCDMTGKLFKDIKTSVNEILHTYKENRAKEAAQVKSEENVGTPKATTTVTPPVTPEEKIEPMEISELPKTEDPKK